MASEKFANRPETTVAVAYEATDTTIEVADASDFPAIGDFRIVLGNSSGTILKVTAVAGDVFTVTAEEFDDDAEVGDSVKIVASKGAAERFLQTPNGAEIAMYGGIAGADKYGPVWRLGDPTAQSWSWQNQGGAAVVEANGLVFFTAPSSTTSIRQRLITAPATPWSATALLRSNSIAGTQYSGLALRDAAGLVQIFYILSTGAIQAVRFSSDTAFSGVGPLNTTAPISGAHWHWLRITDNGTNLIFALSTDGVNFVDYGSESRTTHFAAGPTQVGIFANVDSSAAAFSSSFASFRMT